MGKTNAITMGKAKAKGQIILEAIFLGFKFFQKTNEIFSKFAPATRAEVIHSLFGRIEKRKKCF